MPAIGTNLNHLRAGFLSLPELERFLAERLERLADGRPVLSGDDLTGADLRGLHLSGIRLDRVSLRGADLRGSVMSDVVLDHCDLTGARLDGSRWLQVSGRYVIADNTCWRDAVVDRCHLLGSFRRADFTGVTWRDVEFYSSDLRGSRGTLPEGVKGGSLRVGVPASPAVQPPPRHMGAGLKG